MLLQFNSQLSFVVDLVKPLLDTTGTPIADYDLYQLIDRPFSAHEHQLVFLSGLCDLRQR